MTIATACSRGNPSGRSRTAAQDLPEILTLDVLHREEVLPALAADVEDLRDVGMMKCRGEARLVQEHPDELLVGGVLPRMLLSTTSFSKPSMPTARARNISAMPPTASRRKSSYLPSRSPGARTNWSGLRSTVSPALGTCRVYSTSQMKPVSPSQFRSRQR